jgi:predicted small lipoprotein YifL
MKKFLTAVLAIALSLSLAACGGTTPAGSGEAPAGNIATETTTEATTTTATTTEATTTEATTTEAITTEAPADSLTGSVAMDKLVAKMEDGEFGFDFVLTMKDNADISTVGSVAVKDEKIDMIMDTEVLGEPGTMHILVADGKTHILDDAAKTVFTMEEEIGLEMEPFTDSDFADITLTETGEAEVYGETLTFEDYEQGGETVRFYVKNNEIYAYETMDGENAVLLIFTSFEDDVPDDRFVVPADYTEVE